MANTSVFVLSHWGQGGKGSGYTIVIASSRNIARFMVRDYLNAKSEGYRQFHNMNSFEVELLEDSTLFAHLDIAPTSEHGVHSEYWLTPEDEGGETSQNEGGQLIPVYFRA